MFLLTSPSLALGQVVLSAQLNVSEPEAYAKAVFAYASGSETNSLQ
jgi:hypothetical protein